MTRKPGNVGDRPTIHTVAKAAGVGVGTVSRVLNGHPSVRSDTRQRVLAVIEQLDYRPGAPARRAAPEETQGGLLGLATGRLHTPWESRVLSGVTGALERQPYQLLALAAETGVPGMPPLLSPAQIGNLVQGMLLCTDGVAAAWNAQERPQAAVRVGAAVAGGGMDYVAVDNCYGGQLAGEYAATLPGVLVAVWLQPDHAPAARTAARKGFAEGVQGTGRSIDAEFEIDPADHLPRIAGELLDRVPRQATVMTVDDSVALALLHEAQARGLEIGEDLRIIGYGDHASAALANLTTIHQPLEELGCQGAAMLLSRLRERQEGRRPRDQQCALLPPRLALRGTA